MSAAKVTAGDALARAFPATQGDPEQIDDRAPARAQSTYRTNSCRRSRSASTRPTSREQRGKRRRARACGGRVRGKAEIADRPDPASCSRFRGLIRLPRVSRSPVSPPATRCTKPAGAQHEIGAQPGRGDGQRARPPMLAGAAGGARAASDGRALRPCGQRAGPARSAPVAGLGTGPAEQRIDPQSAAPAPTRGRVDEPAGTQGGDEGPQDDSRGDHLAQARPALQRERRGDREGCDQSGGGHLLDPAPQVVAVEQRRTERPAAATSTALQAPARSPSASLCDAVQRKPERRRQEGHPGVDEPRVVLAEQGVTEAERQERGDGIARDEVVLERSAVGRRGRPAREWPWASVRSTSASQVAVSSSLM